MGSVDAMVLLRLMRTRIWPTSGRMSECPTMHELEGLRRRVVAGDMDLEDYERCVEILLERPLLREISRKVNTPTLRLIAHTSVSELLGVRWGDASSGYGACPSADPVARDRSTDRQEARVSQDRFPLPGGGGFRVVFEYARGHRPRAVGIASDLPVEAGGRSSNNLLLWEDTTPAEVEVGCPTALAEVVVYNAYIAPGMPAGLASGAMTVTGVPGGRIYHCSSGLPGGEPDDLIFRLERYTAGLGSGHLASGANPTALNVYP